MGLATDDRTWEDASSPAALGLVRRFEDAWRLASGRRLDPDDFLPDDRRECPGGRLALLRADLALRWESGDRTGAAWYRDRYRDLGAETLVALIYEEFCLREEDDGTADPAAFVARFPEVASRLRRVFEIHGLVGAGPASMGDAPASTASPFPQAGQTIAGFFLVEELGRGAFARVFRAEERQLADRPVALKVARTGSREPQTLARLQHTHIVPVHSYRTDPATGLHLLCMPYFGRVTLAQVLADPQVRVARSGADLVEAIDRLGVDEAPASNRSAGRAALGRRTFAQAIAWWGARMAEALAHAHDHGVLHRDIKPSNVLLTRDALPMLLDFNLAREPMIEGDETASAALGGTFDYMAPEHLEELADGVANRVDARSDIFSLGVLIFEALMGERPFAPPRGALSASEALLRAVEERRRAIPRLRLTHPEVPAALESIVVRCLAADPVDRYASAADLAVDFQAVADDQSLRFAREPIVSRTVRGLRRNRRLIAMAVPVVVALLIASTTLHKVELDKALVEAEAKHLFEAGRRSFENRNERQAAIEFASASRLAQERPELHTLFRQARAGCRLAEQSGQIRAQTTALFDASETLRSHLSGLDGDPSHVSDEIRAALRPFYALDNVHWTELPALVPLGEPTRSRLVREVDALLFLWAAGLDRAGDQQSARQALAVCHRALVFAQSKGPWLALRARSVARLGLTTPEIASNVSGEETQALACFEWGMLQALEGRRDGAIAWLKRAVELDPGDFWYPHALARLEERAGRLDDALAHDDIAVALRPASARFRESRARVRHARAIAWP